MRNDDPGRLLAAVAGYHLCMARPSQPTRDETRIDDERDALAKDPKHPSEPKKSDEMRKADISDGESP
jgi:hypothetical protein